MADPTTLPSWKQLTKDAATVPSIASLFETEKERASSFSLLDYSKNALPDSARQHLLALYREAGVAQAVKQMYEGVEINETEDRKVLHVALRARQGDSWGRKVVPVVREQMDEFVRGVHGGTIVGSTGKTFNTVVNIGIGGSDLGPVMVTQALAPFAQPGMRVHYVSNVDGAHLHAVLAQIEEPDRVLFCIASKTFTTQETMLNARSAKAWLTKRLDGTGDADQHFIALSTNSKEVKSFGIDPDSRMFPFWDWVGGRYSLWSAIGLSIELYVGVDNFRALLDGANTLDRHFYEKRDTPLDNLPAMLALVGVWNTNFLGTESHAVLPYDQHLARLPAYLQQADMESNGKSVRRDGSRITNYATGPVIWGEPGTNGQHAFYQLLHQGTRRATADFLAACNPSHGTDMAEHHPVLLANFFAQTEALMLGKTEDEAKADLLREGVDASLVDHLAPHKTFPGNRATNSILYTKLTPFMLGALVAMYEHKIFVQGRIWQINSFDQFGVELGKVLAKRVLPELAEDVAGPVTSHDGSTNQLINFYRSERVVGSEGAAKKRRKQ